MSDSVGIEGMVYLVDDDQSVLRALGRLIKSAGWNVKMFQSAREFLEQHPSESLGCLVLDLTMPSLGGLELQEELPHSHHFSHRKRNCSVECSGNEVRRR